MDMLTPFDQARIRRPSCWPVAACIFLFGAGALPAGNHYVRPPGTCTNTQLQAPYGSWGDAATSIQWAVDAAMAALPATVWVTNGSYCVTNQITVTNAITLKSVTGWTNTVVYADWPACTTRVFYLSNNVAIDGFTVSNGHEFSALGGGGMYAVSNCIVRNCRIIYNVSSNAVGYTGAKGGGVFADRGSIVSNCLVLNNRVIGAWQYGAGIALGVNSAALNCQAISNSGSGGGYGGGYIRRCLDGRV